MCNLTIVFLHSSFYIRIKLAHARKEKYFAISIFVFSFSRSWQLHSLTQTNFSFSVSETQLLSTLNLKITVQQMSIPKANVY